MGVVESLPGRPLKPSEVAALAEADGIEAAEPVVYRGDPPGVECVILIKDGQAHTLGWHPRRGGWEVIRAEGVE